MADREHLRLMAVSIDHRSAPVELRERLAFRPDRLEAAVRELAETDGVEEAAILSTCNRVELYVAGADPDRLDRRSREFLEDYHGLAASAFDGALRRIDGDDAVRHLFRVAGSIESMVMGEAEILGQVKEAYESACEAGAVGPALRSLFETAFTVAKEIRTRTGIGRTRVSVASAAVELAGKVFDRLAGRPILVIGTGRMAAGMVEHLRAAGADRIAVTSRTRERAEAFAGRFGAEPFTHEQIPERLGESDIVLVSTEAPLFLLTCDMARSFLRRRREPLLIVDISVPRNVDPRVGELRDCFLYSIDDLQDIVRRNRAERTDAANESEPMIEDGLRRFHARLSGPDAAGAVGLLRSTHERLCLAVLRQHADRIGPAGREAIEKAARRLVNKAMHPVLQALSDERRRGEEDPDDLPLHRAVERLFSARANREGGSRERTASAAAIAAVRTAVEAARDAEMAAGFRRHSSLGEAEREAFAEALQALTSAIVHDVASALDSHPDPELARSVVRLYTRESPGRAPFERGGAPTRAAANRSGASSDSQPNDSQKGLA